MASDGRTTMHKTMALAAADQIRSRILDGRYPTNFQLRQESVATDLGMSRVPVREALVLLEAEGLVRILPYRGAIVVELSVAEVLELFDMRALLEPFLLARSAPRMTADDLRRLEDVHARYVGAVEAVDMERLNSLNTEFHLELYRHADRPRMLATVQTLLAECDRHTRIQLSNVPDDRRRAVAEHASIIELCRSREFDEAVDVMRRHILHIGDVLTALLQQRERGGTSA